MSPRNLLISSVALAFPSLSFAERSLYLNTFDLTHFISGWNKTLANQALDKKPLQVGNQTFTQGIWTHAPCTAKLSMPEDALFLSATVGVQKQEGNGGSVRFLVKAEDNSILFDSGLMKADTPARDLEVSLAGHRTVFLVVDPGSDGNYGDHAVWGQARLIVGGEGTPAPSFIRNDTLSPTLTSLQVPVDSPAEGLLLGNGTLGTSVWGDARNLRFSLDLAGLWSSAAPLTTPPLIGLNPATAASLLGQTSPDSENTPRRLPLGRFELKHNLANTIGQLNLNHDTATALASFLGSNISVTAYVHAEEPVLIINTGQNEFQSSLLPPPVAAKLGLPEPEKGSEDIPEGKLTWYSLATSPKATFVAALHRPKATGFPHLYLVSGETAETVAAARETVLARLQKIAAADPKAVLKIHTDWWKKQNTETVLVPGPPEWRTRLRLARLVLASSARGVGEPGGWLWTFEESDPARLPAAASTGYPANAPLFATSRLGFAETAESQARWHLARREAYLQHAQKNFGTEGIVAPGLLRPDGSPAALAPSALAPALSAQAAWPFQLVARFTPDSALARESALAWNEDTARALAVLAGGEAARSPRLPWGVAPGSSVPGSAASWQDSLLLRSSFSGTFETARALGVADTASRWSEMAARVALPATSGETSPGLAWSNPADWPSHLLGHHPLHLAGLPSFSLPSGADSAKVPASNRLWMACAAARNQPDAAVSLAASIPLGRNGLPLAATAEPGGVQGLLAQTLELAANFCLAETPEGAVLVFPSYPKGWATGSFKRLPVSGGARIGAEWSNESLREISIFSARDTDVSLVDSFGAKGFKTSHKSYRRASGKIIVTLKAGETAVLKAP